MSEQLRLRLAGTPRQYMDSNFLMTVRTATTQMLENRLCAIAIFDPGRSARIQKDIEKLAGQLAVEGVSGTFGVPEIMQVSFGDLDVVMAYGVVVKGETRRGRLEGDYWFVIMHADELELALDEVFKLEKVLTVQ